MEQRYFAVFDDDMRRIKVVHMIETLRSTVQFLPYSYRGLLRIELSKEPEPMLKKFTLDSGEDLYLWRTPWCMYKQDTHVWIPILDSNTRSRLPGPFTLEANYSKHYQAHMKLHANMLYEAEAIDAMTPKAPPIVTKAPPRFLCEMIKRDAIATKRGCGICLEDIKEDMKTLITPCFHIFDATSLEMWIARKECCAICKAPVKRADCVLL
jgi:hypothetical protein